MFNCVSEAGISLIFVFIHDKYVKFLNEPDISEIDVPLQFNCSKFLSEVGISVIFLI